MEVEEAIRSRRTHKAYRREPVDRATLDELFELARWAPNHHLTNPWRFRVARPARARAAEAGGRAARRRRSSTARRPWSSARARSAVTRCTDEEDLHATAIAAYIVLLAAHARGLGGYWRTPGVLRTAEGRRAVGLGPDEHFVALIHLGHPVQEKPGARARADRGGRRVPGLSLMLARDTRWRRSPASGSTSS